MICSPKPFILKHYNSLSLWDPIFLTLPFYTNFQKNGLLNTTYSVVTNRRHIDELFDCPQGAPSSALLVTYPVTWPFFLHCLVSHYKFQWDPISFLSHHLDFIQYGICSKYKWLIKEKRKLPVFNIAYKVINRSLPSLPSPFSLKWVYNFFSTSVGRHDLLSMLQGWKILAFFKQYNTSASVLQYNTIPIPMQY